MKRERLVFLACGLAGGIALSLLAQIVDRGADKDGIDLVLEGSGYDLEPRERRSAMPLEPNEYEPWKAEEGARRRISTSVVEEALACRSGEFKILMPSDGFSLALELNPRSATAANCLIAVARKNNIPFKISDSEN